MDAVAAKCEALLWDVSHTCTFPGHALLIEHAEVDAMTVVLPQLLSDCIRVPSMVAWISRDTTHCCFENMKWRQGISILFLIYCVV